MRKTDKFDAEYQELIRNHQQMLGDFIFSICPDRDAVDDILQETNRVLWVKRNKFEPGTNFSAWSRKIAHFQTLGYLKNSKRKSWLHFDSDLVQTLAEAFEDRDEFREQRAAAMKECRLRLSTEDQQLLNMRYELKLSNLKKSEKTQRTEGAMKQVFLRIRNQLKKCIEQKIRADSE